jgi:hypothetical protein
MSTPTEVYKATVKSSIEDQTGEGSVTNQTIAQRFYEAADLITATAANNSVALAGPATATTNPGASTTPRYYTFSTAGTYTNFKDSTNASIVVAANEAGYLVYNGTYWTKQTIPVDLSGKADTSALAALDLAVYKKTDIDARISLTSLENFPFFMSDLQNKVCFAINAAGAIAIAKFVAGLINGSALTDGTVSKVKLDSATLSQIGIDIDERSGYLYTITDNSNKILFGITNKGKLYGNFDFSGLPVGSIAADKLSSDVTKYLNPGNVNDRDFSDTDDNLYHCKHAQIKKQLTRGKFFERFPPVKTRLITGQNITNSQLEFRKSIPLAFKGEKRIGVWSPDPITDIRYVGYVSPTHALPSSTAGLVTGDYFRVYSPNTTPFTTTGGITVAMGDLIVFNGTNFIEKWGPMRLKTVVEGDFVEVTSAGNWETVSYAAGDRIYVQGVSSASADGRFYFMAKGKAGEYFYMGEFNPSSFTLPTTPTNGDIYQASFDGSINSDLSFKLGDYLARMKYSWGVIKNHTIDYIYPGQFFAYSVNDASDMEVRYGGLDTVVFVSADVRINQQQIPYKEAIRIWGDSMSTPFTTDFAAVANGREFKVTNMGGATSNEILSMFRRETTITTDDDGKTFIFVHGQNNGIYWEQTVEAALKMLNIVGSRTRRYVFVSTLGQRDATWNGTRFVVFAQEGAVTNSNYIAFTEQWYQAMMPNHLFNFRLQMATKADETPDPQNPGMTELQVYNTYGILPFSYWFDYTAAGFTPNQLNYVGTWNTASPTLPTGGNDYDYYLRIGNGSIGNLIVKKPSLGWTEYSYDRIHLNQKGRTIYMQLINRFLTDNKF